MKLLKLFLLMSILFDVAFTIIQDQGGDETTSLREVSHFGYPQRWHTQVGCNKFPRSWRSWRRRGPGHDCYQKKKWDSNALMDQFNCGKRGNMCGYGQICCGGKCVNPFFDKANCGSCNSGCNNGEFCAFGMCNYAT